jgi:putative transposase
MPQSLHSSYAHIVFSTKDRTPTITGSLEPDLHSYLGGIVKSLKGEPVKINGTADHVHLCIRVSKTVSDSEFLQKLKGSSSRWVNEERKIAGRFSWQAGYGWFSVSPTHVDRVIEYIEGQKEHHRTVGFKEEFREFLERYGIEYDERYVWD